MAELGGIRRNHHRLFTGFSSYDLTAPSWLDPMGERILNNSAVLVS